MLNNTLNYLDVETTGGSYKKDQIIEIGILKYKNGKLVDTYDQLIRPTVAMDPYAQRVHGISKEMLADEPLFEEIMYELLEFLGEGIIVAHNARFDFSFLKHSYIRHQILFNVPYVCSVKVSRFLYPGLKKHGLTEIILREKIKITNRHRALSDAQVIADFINKSVAIHGDEKVNAAFKNALHQVAIPKNLVKFDFKKIPNSPGVYIFKNDVEIPIYVGKSITLKDRIKSHFYSDTRSDKEMEMSLQVADIEIIETVGELGALIREALFVKNLKPRYNHKLKSKRKIGIILEENKDGYNSIKVKRIKRFENDTTRNLLGLFSSQRAAKDFVEAVCANPILCKQKLLEPNKKGACFNYHLGKCNGACIDLVKAAEFNNILLKVFENKRINLWPFDTEFELIESNGQETETFVIDNWIIKSASNGLPIEQKEFDYDLYQILRKVV